MAEIKTAIIAHLNADATSFAIFGNRLTADKVPDGQDYPNGRIWMVTEEQNYHHSGAGGRKPLAQIDVYAETELEADAGAAAIKSSLSGYKGMLGSSLYAGICTARHAGGSWNEEARNYHRILEVEVGTND